MKAALEKNGFKGCKDADLEPVFTYLEFCLKQVGGTFCFVCVGTAARTRSSALFPRVVFSAVHSHVMWERTVWRFASCEIYSCRGWRAEVATFQDHFPRF